MRLATEWQAFMVARQEAARLNSQSDQLKAKSEQAEAASLAHLSVRRHPPYKVSDDITTARGHALRAKAKALRAEATLVETQGDALVSNANLHFMEQALAAYGDVESCYAVDNYERLTVTIGGDVYVSDEILLPLREDPTFR